MTVPLKKSPGTWVQTDREAHEAWAALTRRSGLAAQIMHLLAARVGDHNAVVISQGVLADIAGASRRGVQNALKLLVQERWIQLVQIGTTGSVNAHIINSRVVWSDSREKLPLFKFNAVVIASVKEQPDPDGLDVSGDVLRPLPRADEGQLPAGPGMPPPSEPTFEGFEPDLPSSPARSGFDEPRPIGEFTRGILPGTDDEKDQANG